MKLFAKAPLALAVLAATSSYAGAEDSAALDKVVVTGQKMERSLQDTVDSVRIIDTEQIEEENIADLYDVVDRTPNLAGRKGVGFTIRGIDAFNVSGGGNSFLASVYVDGAPVPYRAIQEGAFTTWDVAQVEVLRGPQSTLQGRNALAGALVVRTQDPTYDWDAKGRFILGSYGRKEGAVAFGGGTADEQIAFRVAAEKKEYDGYIKNPHRSENGNYSKDKNLRAKVLFEPDFADGLRVLFTHNNGDKETGVPWQSPDSKDRYDDPQVFFNDRTREMVESKYNTLEVSYDFSDRLSITSITSDSTVDYSYDWDGDAGPDLNDTLIDDRRDETLSQELRLNFNFDRVSGVVGAYYSDLEVNDNYSGTRSYKLNEAGITPQGLVDLAAGMGQTVDLGTAGIVTSFYTPYDPARLDTYGDIHQEVKTAAVFSDVTVKVTDKVDVFAGLRYDRETQKSGANNDVQLLSELPDPVAAGTLVEQGALAQGADAATAAAQGAAIGGFITQINGFVNNIAVQASQDEPEDEDTFSAWLPKAGATLHMTEEMATSFTAQKGYRSGGVGSNIQQAYTYTYDPEYIWNYELSFRSTWMDGRLAANANLFYLDWKDQQVSIQLSDSTYDTETVNAGRSEVQGAEAEMFYFDGNFSGYFGLGYSKTKFKKFVDRGVNLAGRRFPGAPEWTANIGGTYRLDNGFVFHGNANYQDEAFAKLNPATNNVPVTDPTYDPKNHERTVVNVSAGYEWDQVSLVLAVDNLFDEEYVEAANVGFGSETIGTPRAYSLRLEASMW